MQPTSRTLPAIAFVAAVALLPLASPAMAQLPSAYDPERCKSDAQGKLYVAFGRNVLAVPAARGHLAPLQFSFPADLKRRAPDPSEAEGCPDNPQQLSTYYLSYPGAKKVALHFAAPSNEPTYWDQD